MRVKDVRNSTASERRVDSGDMMLPATALPIQVGHAGSQVCSYKRETYVQIKPVQVKQSQ